MKTGDWNVICAVRDKAKMQRQAEALGFPKGRCVLLEISRKQGHAHAWAVPILVFQESPCVSTRRNASLLCSAHVHALRLAVSCLPCTASLSCACSYEIREVDLRSLDSVRKFCNSLTSPIG